MQQREALRRIQVLHFCERLNVIEGRWVEIAPLPVPRFALKGAVSGSKILATGGVAFTGKSLTEYDLIDI